jgi:hypothetical protein
MSTWTLDPAIATGDYEIIDEVIHCHYRKLGSRRCCNIGNIEGRSSVGIIDH